MSVEVSMEYAAVFAWLADGEGRSFRIYHVRGAYVVEVASDHGRRYGIASDVDAVKAIAVALRQWETK